MADEAIESMGEFDDDNALEAVTVDKKVVGNSERQFEIKRKLDEVLEARKLRDEDGDLDDWD